MKTSLKIVNIVGIVYLENNVDYQKLSIELDGEYRKRYVIYRTIYGVLKVFPSGKIVMVGVKNLEKVLEIIRKYFGKIKSVNINNIVAISNLRLSEPIRLDILYRRLLEESRWDVRCIYEPQIFSSMMCSLDGVSLLIFSNGEIILSGSISLMKYIDVLSTIRRCVIELNST